MTQVEARDRSFVPISRLWIALALAAAALFLIGFAQLTNAGGAAIPADARSTALESFQGEYGQVSEVYAEDSTTFEEWAKAEPENSSGIQVTSENASNEVYALFVEGHFEIQGPLMPEGPSVMHATGGRVLFDSTGEIVFLQLWSGPSKPADPAFGAAFEGSD